jgi:hypothetical protein
VPRKWLDAISGNHLDNRVVVTLFYVEEFSILHAEYIYWIHFFAVDYFMTPFQYGDHIASDDRCIINEMEVIVAKSRNYRGICLKGQKKHEKSHSS